jgi:hypothetical protein
MVAGRLRCRGETRPLGAAHGRRNPSRSKDTENRPQNAPDQNGPMATSG